VKPTLHKPVEIANKSMPTDWKIRKDNQKNFRYKKPDYTPRIDSVIHLVSVQQVAKAAKDGPFLTPTPRGSVTENTGRQTGYRKAL
jgi:hypothetical protein